MSPTTFSSDVEQLKTRLKQIWMAGDYDRFSRYLEPGRGNSMSASTSRWEADSWTSGAAPVSWR